MMASPTDDAHTNEFSADDLDDYESNDFYGHFSDDSDDLDSNKAGGDTMPERESASPSEENAELVALTAEVDALCSQANKELDRLPRATRNKLVSETRDIFKSYEQHGSQKRLASALEKFLLTGDEGLRFVPEPEPLQPKPQVSRNIDPESAPLIRTSPLHAADLEFEIGSGSTFPPFLLPALDRIFGLYAAEADALLKHHSEKYGDEPIFRAGIREYIQSQLRGIMESTADDSLSITPENRTFLRSVYERSPRLNLAEKRMLCRATRLGIETVEMFWDDLTVQRRAYMGMRQFVAARELEKLHKERREMAERREREERERQGKLERGLSLQEWQDMHR